MALRRLSDGDRSTRNGFGTKAGGEDQCTFFSLKAHCVVLLALSSVKRFRPQEAFDGQSSRRKVYAAEATQLQAVWHAWRDALLKTAAACSVMARLHEKGCVAIARHQWPGEPKLQTLQH